MLVPRVEYRKILLSLNRCPGSKADIKRLMSKRSQFFGSVQHDKEQWEKMQARLLKDGYQNLPLSDFKCSNQEFKSSQGKFAGLVGGKNAIS